MAAQVAKVLLALALQLNVGLALQLYLVEECGQTVNLQLKGTYEMLLNLSRTSEYTDNMDCSLTVNTWPGQYLYVHFREISLSDCVDSVHLYAQSVDLSSALCEGKDKSYTVMSDQAQITFRSGASGHIGQFHAVFTSFYTTDADECPDEWFKCEDAGWCIHEALKCNGRRNCHQDDGSDEDDKNSGDDNLWWIILLGVLGGIIVICGVGFAVYMCYRKNIKTKNKGRVISTNPAFAVPQGQVRHELFGPPIGSTHQTGQSGPQPGSTLPPIGFAQQTDQSGGQQAFGGFTYNTVPPAAVYGNPAS